MWRLRATTRIGWLGALLLALATASGAETDPGRVLLVLDASGSMWGQIGGEPKIGIAREVVRDLMEDWDESLALGLSSYGHRREGDCEDIELLIPTAAGNAAAVAERVEALSPKGKTPLSEAVKRAAEHLAYTEDPAVVVLVSDGEETCGADPCAVAEALEAAGADFTAHVIGFDVALEKQAGLRCLAEATGGEFLAAADAGELRTSLGRALEKAKEGVGPPLHFQASLVEGGPALRKEDLTWMVAWSVARDDGAGAPAKARDAKVGFELEPGAYTAELQWDVVRRSLPFDVVEGERATHTIAMEAGVVSFVAALTDGGPRITEPLGWTFYAANPDGSLGEKLAYKSGSTRSFVVPAGSNTVVAKLGDAVRHYSFSIEAGVRDEHVVSLRAGRARFSAVASDGTGRRGYKTWTIRAEPDGQRAGFKADESPTFVLAAGRYVAELGFDGQKITQVFEVKPGETGEHQLTLP